jgi:hypothetical protein
MNASSLCAAPHFLTRAGGQSDPDRPTRRRVNTVVVTEWTYLFCQLVADKLAPATSSQWELFIGLIGAKSRPWSLAAAEGRPTSGNMWFSDGKPSQLDKWQHNELCTLDPGADAYRLLSAFYEVFGLNYDSVDLVVDGRVDPDLIAAIR